MCLWPQKAEAELAYELQGAKEKQRIRSEEMEIEVVERRKQIEVEEKEILRKDKGDKRSTDSGWSENICWQKAECSDS